MAPEKIDNFFDANLNFWLDCKTCTMCNNDSKNILCFPGTHFPSGKWRILAPRGKSYFSKARLGPTWALMTSQRKSMRARGHFYGGYGTFFPALLLLWNSHCCHLGPAWGLASICRPPRYPFWGGDLVGKTCEFFTLWGPRHPCFLIEAQTGPTWAQERFKQQLGCRMSPTSASKISPEKND